MSRQAPAIEVVELTEELTPACVALEVEPHQREFVSPVADYLDLCDRPDSPWRPFAITIDDAVVGFVMHGVDPADDTAWIGGLVIDRAHQRRGVGRTVVEELVARAASSGRSSALSYEPSNVAAEALYERAGFIPTGEMEDDEVVARRPL